MSAADEQFKKKLIERYVAGDASEKELQAFFGLLTEAEIVSLIEEHMDQEILRLREEQHLLTPVRRFKFWKYAAVVSGFIFASYGGYYIFHNKNQNQQIVQNQQPEIKPGVNQATLTLGNGQKIILVKGLKGILAHQGGTTIQAQAGSGIVYTAINSTEIKREYNTMSTTKGQMSPYPLILADGTAVWLNAASSITFPTVFEGKNREVKVTGEAYFEVAHNAAKPFRVQSNGQTVEVLGTHFDINSYNDEPVIKTTLFEGKVKVTKNGQTALLKPGQQSSTSVSNNEIVVKEADMATAIAWKNGLFKYKLADIKSVMRDLGRWYDVDIQYEGNPFGRTFTGEIYRDLNASEALQLLSYAKVKFRIEGKKIIVTSN